LFGPLNPDNDNLVDMNAREVVAALPLVIFFFILGLFPNLLFDKINPSAEAIVSLSNQEPTLSQLRITNVE
jgi:NADH-quinone oxidoreductase subunit M